MGFVNYEGPDLDKYIVGKKHAWVTYEEGAKLYNIPYWTFVHLAKEAKATLPLRRTTIVDLMKFEPYFMSVLQRDDPKSRIGKGGKSHGKEKKCN